MTARTYVCAVCNKRKRAEHALGRLPTKCPKHRRRRAADAKRYAARQRAKTRAKRASATAQDLADARRIAVGRILHDDDRAAAMGEGVEPGREDFDRLVALANERWGDIADSGTISLRVHHLLERLLAVIAEGVDAIAPRDAIHGLGQVAKLKSALDGARPVAPPEISLVIRGADGHDVKVI
tara:strand:+ start:49 stop:594 length:546 start_codon:yes stop_codon:yes gene_type:complete